MWTFYFQGMEVVQVNLVVTALLRRLGILLIWPFTNKTWLECAWLRLFLSPIATDLHIERLFRGLSVHVLLLLLRFLCCHLFRSFLTRYTIKHLNLFGAARRALLLLRIVPLSHLTTAMLLTRIDDHHLLLVTLIKEAFGHHISTDQVRCQSFLTLLALACLCPTTYDVLFSIDCPGSLGSASEPLRVIQLILHVVREIDHVGTVHSEVSFRRGSCFAVTFILDCNDQVF